jgi:hypothetical protein
MSETIQTFEVWRAFRPDIDEAEPWLMPKLLKAYPAANIQYLRSALVNGCVSNDQWVGRTRNAMLGLRAVHENFVGPMSARVWFALARHGEEDAEEVAELHVHAAKWAQLGGMCELILSPVLDCDRSYIRARLGGKILARTFHSWSWDG